MHLVNKHLEKVQTWCYANKVTINLKKTSYMLIRSRRRSVKVNGALEISGSEISEVNMASFVGLQIDNHLTWGEHIKMVNKNVRKKVGIFIQTQSFMSHKMYYCCCIKG